MEPDSFDLLTPPSIPIPPAQKEQPPWPRRSGDQPPTQRPPWPLLAVIAGIAVALLIALLFSLLLSARGGTTTILLGPAANQTATASSAQATASAGGTPATRATGTTSPRASATPRPPSPAVQIVTAQAAVGSGAPVRVSCPNGELALSGGWRSDASANIYLSTRSGGSSGNGWQVSPFSAESVLVSAYILCLQHVAGASIVEREAQTFVAAGATGTVVANCTTGEVPVGGAFNIAFPSLNTIGQFGPTTDHKGFSLTMVNHASVTVTSSVFAECLKASGTHVTVPSPVTKDVSPGGSGAVQTTCPQGTLLSGGGIDALFGSAAIFEFSPSSATTWQAHVQNQSKLMTTVHLSALCLSFA